MGMVEKNGNKISGGLGAVLTQIHEDKKEQVMGYVSRKLKKHEEYYQAFLLELLAVTFWCEHYHHYLYGQKRFSIFSDHKPQDEIFQNMSSGFVDIGLDTADSYAQRGTAPRLKNKIKESPNIL